MKTIYSITGEELILGNYKEPMRVVPKGYGYMGALLATKDGSKIQCHICGKLYEGLNMHIQHMHKMTTREYKEKFEIAYQTALVSETRRQILKDKTMKWLQSMTKEELSEFNLNKMKKLREYLAKKLEHRMQPKLTLESKNKRGTCPDQLLEKINVCAKSIGHSPTKMEFIDFYASQKYIHIIYKTFGSWDKAKKMAGHEILKSDSNNLKGKTRHFYTRDEVIEYFQIFFQENDRPPTCTDCRRGLIPDYSVIKGLFGSMQAARDAAGITGEVGRWKIKNKII